MKTIERLLAPHLLKLAQLFRVVTILGPRQSGKTTLARTLFSDYNYVNLELPSVRQLALNDPLSFFANYKTPLIIDEIQHVPDLLSYIQVFVDENKKMGEFILTGSHQPLLKAGIAQSLAGRTALATLLPLSIAELTKAGFTLERDDYLFKGFMPQIYAEKTPPTLLYENYYRTYVERDVRQLINVRDQGAFEMFLRLLAGRIGQLVNLQSLANDIGVTSTTLAAWISVLEASFLIFRLQPYYKNFGKRMIKSPKIYFTDVGLAASLLQITSARQIMRDPLIGGLFENMVVVEALKARYNTGLPPNLYFFRDRSGLEIDLLLESEGALHGYEIKSARTWRTDYGNNLRKFAQTVAPLASRTIIYAGDPIAGAGDSANILNFTQVAAAMVDNKVAASG